MQQAVGGKCSIVILDDLVPVGEEIYMRQEQFRRVGIHCEVQFINGRLLRRTDLRREDVIPDMLDKARGGSKIRYPEMFQQSFQLWELLFTEGIAFTDSAKSLKASSSIGRSANSAACGMIPS